MTSTQTGGVGFKDEFDLVASATKLGENFFIGACRVGGIVKSPVVAVYLSRKHRTRLVRIATDRDDCINLLIEEFAQVLGAMAGNVDADFLHDLDSFGMNVTGWLRAGAMDVNEVACSSV